MDKKYSAKRTLRFLIGSWKYTPLLTVSAIIFETLGVFLSQTVAPIFFALLLQNISNGTATLNNSIGLLITYGLVVLFGEVIFYRISLAFAYIFESKIRVIVDEKVLRHLTTKSLGFHANRMAGGIVSDTNSLLDGIESFWDNILFNIIPVSTVVISSCIALGFIFWQFALILAVASFIIATIVIMIQTTTTKYTKEVTEKTGGRTGYLADIVGNISAVKSFAREDYELTQYKSKINKWHKAILAEMKQVLIITSAFSSIMSLMYVGAFAAAIVATEYHLASISTIYLVITYTINIGRNLWEIASSTRGYIRAVGRAAPMIETLDSEIEIKDPKFPQPSKINNGKIEFQNISFTHDNNNDALFNNFSLTIDPGEKVGIVGSSGSGKTSLTRLLLRFSDVDSGAILIDNQDIRNITQKDLHKSIAFVPQEPSLFHRSLKENIAYGKPTATLEEINKAAKQANALDFIEVLKDGFDTLVGERGIKLSGGQRQRIAIARAILKDAPILVLDEATSALDSETENLIQQALKKLMKGRTSIVIAHRLSTISSLDRIIVMEEGKIVEQGSHEELLKKNGVYCKLWQRQSGGFIKD